MSEPIDLQTIPLTPGHARRIARGRWGDVPVTVEWKQWGDGDYGVEAFHTVASFPHSAARVCLRYQKSEGVWRESFEFHDRVDQRIPTEW